ncbi:MAG: ribonuclease P protein subunit [Candidatus Thorarchaeota archaeon]|nr:ribonuclease P protein subunit [Candidatus Thorarchaeota archaeon]MCK5238614.1 ribonuclease P protein subunit [Candidatus Thorarchaeota archaeon]
MTPITPLNILNHELIGLETHVVGSRDPGHVSKKGTVVAETREMIQLDTANGEVLLSKEVCVFQITLPDGTVVQVDGNLLKGRPEDRMKKRQNRRW